MDTSTAIHDLRTALTGPIPGPVRVSAAYVTRLRACLNQSWVSSLTEVDVRFPALDDESVAQWLATAIEQGGGRTLHANAYALSERLLAADKATWAEELTDIARCASIGSVQDYVKANPSNRETAFVLRYGGMDGKLYRDIAEEMGVSNPRVQHFINYMWAYLKKCSVATPALSRLMEACQRAAPITLERANTLLAPLLGDGFGMAAAIEFAQLLGQVPLVQRDTDIQAQIDVIRPVGVRPGIKETRTVTWQHALRRHVRSECGAVGCTNFERLVALVANDCEVVLTTAMVEEVIPQIPGFRTLDAGGKWFAIGDTDASSLATQLKKIMCVQAVPLQVEAIGSALARRGRWETETPAVPLPPLYVLTAILSGWPWLDYARSRGTFMSNVPLSESDLLTPSERGAVRTIRAMGGAATKAEIVAHLVNESGLLYGTVTSTLAVSPVLQRLDVAIYGLRTDLLPVEALAEARQRRSLERVELVEDDEASEESQPEAMSGPVG